VIIAAGATLQQGRSALAAILLFALVVVVVVTAAVLLLLSLHRRRQRREAREGSRPAPGDAWREAGRRARPIDSDPLEREAEG